MFIDLSKIREKNPYIKHSNFNINDFIDDDISDVIVFDDCESEIFEPLQNNQDNSFSLVNQQAPNSISVYFITGDANIFNKIHNLKIKDNVEVLFNPYRFYVDEVFHSNDIFIKINNNSSLIYNRNIRKNYYTFNIYEPTYNIICLTSTDKWWRGYILDKFYKHDKFCYSFFPFTTLDKSNIHFNKKSKAIKFEQVFNFKENVLRDGDNTYRHIHNINERIVYKNGFDTYKNVNELTEFNEIYDESFLSEVEYKEPTELTEDDVHFFVDKKFESFDDYVPIEYLKSNIDLIFESYVENSLLFTEKTWKPIVFQKPFIAIAAINYHTTLQKLGYELYDELFDYSFDNTNSLKYRIESVSEQINYYLNIKPKHVKELCKLTTNKRRYNYYHYKKCVQEYMQTGFDVNDNIKLFKKYTKMVNNV